MNLMLLEAGGMLATAPLATERPGEIAARTQLYAKVYAHLGYTAVNVGAHELTIGVDGLRQFAKAAKVPLLSANLRDAQTHATVFEPVLVRQVGPLKIGVIGLLTGQPPDPVKLLTEKGLEVSDPITAAREWVPKLRAQGCDVVVVLSQLRRADIEAMATHIDGIDLILGSMDMELTIQPRMVGKQTLFVDAFTKGKYLMDIGISVRGQRGRLFPARLREALQTERTEAAAQLQTLVSQLEGADSAESPLKLTAETRKVMQDQIDNGRKHIQRLTEQLDSADSKIPEGATTVDVQGVALSSELKDDPIVDGWIKQHQKPFPKLGGH